MIRQLDVSPTRGNLLRLKSDLDGMRRRHALLDRKREALVRELLKRIDEAERLERQQEDLFRTAHEALDLTRMRMGGERVEWIALAPTARNEVKVKTSSVMGVRIPLVSISVEPEDPPYGLGDTSTALDRARNQWLEVLRFVSEASEPFISVWRLAAELRKTRRQVNALETVLIPEHERTIRRIGELLEEEEREDLIHTHEAGARREV